MEISNRNRDSQHNKMLGEGESVKGRGPVEVYLCPEEGKRTKSGCEGQTGSPRRGSW